MKAKLNGTIDKEHAKEGDELEILGVHANSKYGTGIGFLVQIGNRKRYLDSGWFDKNSIIGEIKVIKDIDNSVLVHYN